jgi:hypothetical protein
VVADKIDIALERLLRSPMVPTDQKDAVRSLRKNNESLRRKCLNLMRQGRNLSASEGELQELEDAAYKAEEFAACLEWLLEALATPGLLTPPQEKALAGPLAQARYLLDNVRDDPQDAQDYLGPGRVRALHAALRQARDFVPEKLRPSVDAVLAEAVTE